MLFGHYEAVIADFFMSPIKFCHASLWIESVSTCFLSFSHREK